MAQLPPMRRAPAQRGTASSPANAPPSLRLHRTAQHTTHAHIGGHAPFLWALTDWLALVWFFFFAMLANTASQSFVQLGRVNSCPAGPQDLTISICVLSRTATQALMYTP